MKDGFGATVQAAGWTVFVLLALLGAYVLLYGLMYAEMPRWWQ